jgi:transposase
VVSPEERIEQLERENAALRLELEKLRREIEEWKRGFRERGKRRTSRAEGGARRERKKSGRKTGHPASHRPRPEHVDHEEVHATPDACPCCNGPVELTEETVSTLEVDVPPVKPEVTRHKTVVGRCARCSARVVAPLPGASANGTTVAPVTFGPNLLSIALSMRFDVKASLGAIGKFMGQWFGVEISRGGLARVYDRLQCRSAPACDEITSALRNAPVVGMDETSLRQDGVLGWCWLARTDKLSLYRVELSRGRWVAESILGAQYSGTVVSDFYAVYTDQGTWLNAFCGAHLVRDARKIAELNPCTETEAFRDRIKGFYRLGEAAAKSGNFFARRGVRTRLGHIISSLDYVAFPDIVQLQERIRICWDGVTRFLDDPSVPWHNNATERDFRVVGRYRAITGGTRSQRGSTVFGHWMSVVHTRRKNGLQLPAFVRAVNDAHRHGREPPSVFIN